MFLESILNCPLFSLVLFIRYIPFYGYHEFAENEKVQKIGNLEFIKMELIVKITDYTKINY